MSDQNRKIIWKTEGPTDLIALVSLGLPEGHEAMSNVFGATENPKDLVTVFAGADVFVIHDADEPGQAGAMMVRNGNTERPGWAPLIATQANSCRNVVLPYEVAETRGKDLRDWINEQLEAGLSREETYQKLLEMAWASPIVEPATPEQITAAGKYKASETDEAEKTERLKNYELIQSDSDNPHEAWKKQPIPVPRMAQQLLELHDGWPKCCNNELFVPHGDGYRELRDSSALFGWIAERAPADFYGRDGCVPKKEFFAVLPYHVERFDAIETHPHFPPLERHYYLREAPKPGTGEHLDRFVEFFSFASDKDRNLFVGLILTIFWGGAPGSRPGWLITSEGEGGGTGIGKSKLVEKVARLAGGFISPDKRSEEKLRTDLMAPGESHKRIIANDNKKGYFSSELIESMMTSPEISGHRMYVGYLSRPNTSVWIVTANGASFSRDLSERCITLHLKRPEYDGQWEQRIDRFISEHADDVLADIALRYSETPTKLTSFSRWSAWEAEVLARLPKPGELQTLIQTRSEASDQDSDDAKAITDYFAEKLRFAAYVPDASAVHIPSRIATIWLNDAIGENLKSGTATRLVNQMHEAGSLPRLSKNSCHTVSRGLVWRGENAAAETVNYDLETRLRYSEKPDRQKAS